jgi:hypothetical protein
MCFIHVNNPQQGVVNSSVEASTSAYQSGEGDGSDAVGNVLSKKKSRSPVWHFFNPLSNGRRVEFCSQNAPFVSLQSLEL